MDDITEDGPGADILPGQFIKEDPVYTQADRDRLLASPKKRRFRKVATIEAVQLDHAFVVLTDRGPMEAKAGDWLVTNHPDEDPGYDLWSISDERMRSTYEEVE